MAIAKCLALHANAVNTSNLENNTTLPLTFFDIVVYAETYHSFLNVPYVYKNYKVKVRGVKSTLKPGVEHGSNYRITFRNLRYI